MARVLSTVVVLALLAATAVAFAITEGAKLDKSPIASTRVDPLFSPAGTDKRVAHIRFRLRTRERISVWIRDSHGHNVQDAADESQRPPRRALRPRLGRVLAVGDRAAGRHLRPGREARALPSHDRAAEPIVLDTKPPDVTVKHPQYPLLSPDGDGRRDSFRVAYKLSEPAHAILAVRGRRVLSPTARRRRASSSGTAESRTAGSAREGEAGRYLLTISAQDRASNVSKGFPFAIAQVRYLTLARKRVVVRPGGKFALRVSTDAPRVNWRLHGRSGVQRSRDAAFPAPKSTGVFQLYVFAAGHAANAWWSSHERRRRTDRRRGRRARARAADRRDPPGVAHRGARRLGGRLRDAGRLSRTGRASPGARGCRRVRPSSASSARGSSLRLPWLLALATLACVPARIPVHVGSTEANLLLPLYGVVAVAALALAWELFGEEPRTASWAAGVAARALRRLGGVVVPLDEGRAAGRDRAALLHPPVRPARGRARPPPGRALGVALYVQLVLMALVFAVIGIVQYESREHLLEPEGARRQRLRSERWFYRVNSVFYDPSIYGRFLVVAILASLVVILRRRGDPLWAVAATLTIAITWAGLLPSFSQSSFLALLAAATLCAVLVWRLAEPRAGCRRWPSRSSSRGRVAADPAPLEGKSSSSLSSATSGRSTLVSKGGKVAVQHPLIGVGVGGFRRAYADLTHLRGRSRRRPRRTRRRSPSRPRRGSRASSCCCGSRAPRSSWRSGDSGRDTGRAHVRCERQGVIMRAVVVVLGLFALSAWGDEDGATGSARVSSVERRRPPSSPRAPAGSSHAWSTGTPASSSR